MIYLDNAATTLRKPPQVAAAVLRAMEQFGNVGRGAHEEALSAARTVYDARVRLAALLGCPRPERVCFALNATEALNTAISGLLGPGDHVISTDREHNSVLRPLYRLARNGGAVDFLPADGRGRVDLGGLTQLLRSDTRAVVCAHASNLTGDVTDLAAVGDFCRTYGLLFIVDAAQTAGVLPLDMAALGIDVLCFTGHKGLMGPQGTGGLCVREGMEVAPFKVGGSGVQSFSETQPAEYPTRLEAGTLNGHGLAGLDAALEFIADTGVERIHARESALARRFYEQVRALPGVTLYGDYDAPVRAPIVTLNLSDRDSAEVSDELAERFGVATRPGGHCAPRLHRALGTAEQGAVRFSVSYFNTEDEIDGAAAAVRTLAEEG